MCSITSKYIFDSFDVVYLNSTASKLRTYTFDIRAVLLTEPNITSNKSNIDLEVFKHTCFQFSSIFSQCRTFK